MKLPAIPGMERLRGPLVPHRPLGLRATPAAARASRSTELGDKVVGLDRHRRHRHPVPPAAGRGGQARLRVPAHAVGHRRAGQPADRARRSPSGLEPGLAAGADGQLPGRHARASRSTQDLTDDGWTHHYAAVQQPAPAEGHDASRSTCAAPRSSTSGSWRSTGGGSRSWSPTPTTAEVLKPYYRYLCKRPCFHDEYLQAFNDPNVTLVDCPAGIDAGHRAGPGGRRRAVRGRLPRLRHRASRPSSRRCTAGPATRSSAGTASRLAEKWADGAASLFGMMSRGFPNLFVMPAPGPAGRGHRQLHPARRARRRVRRRHRRRSSSSRASTVFDVSAEAEEDWTQKIVDSFVDGSQRDVGLHAVADQQRGQPARR